MQCDQCGGEQFTKASKDRAGRQQYRCRACRHRLTARTTSAFCGFQFPDDVIALAVRWYLWLRVPYADVATLLAERGIHVDRSSVYDWVHRFTPLYMEAARRKRHPVGRRWSVDETYVKVAGVWRYVYRAIDENGQVVDVLLRERRDTEAAVAFVAQALKTTGVRPAIVTTDKAPAYPPALAQMLPEAEHITGKMEQQRIERDHGHLKSRLRSMQWFKTLATAALFCRAHGFLTQPITRPIYISRVIHSLRPSGRANAPARVEHPCSRPCPSPVYWSHHATSSRGVRRTQRQREEATHACTTSTTGEVQPFHTPGPATRPAPRAPARGAGVPLGGTVGVLGHTVFVAPTARPARAATGGPVGLDMCAPATGPGGTTAPMRMEEDGLQMEMYPTTCTPPTRAELERVNSMMARAKAATDKYRDFRTAVRDGYARTALAFVRGQGYHYLNPAYLDRGFDLRHPPFLVYGKVRGHLVLQGLMYYLPVQTTAQQLAAIFPPSLASWHRHLNVCLDHGRVLDIYTAAACTRQGGDFLATTGWMVHAWLWRAHSGLFTIDM